MGPRSHDAVEDIPFEDALEHARARLFATGSPFAPATADEIAGLDDVVARVDELVRWLADADRFAEHGARLEPGVLFEGPPGTGKTLLARYLATASGARFVNVRDFPVVDELAEADVTALFRHARETREGDGCPVVLFWDELDELSPAPYGHGARARARVVSALLAELDGVCGKAHGVLLVACSNQPDELDPALLRPGRLGLRIELRPPDPAGQRCLLAHQVGRYPGADAVDLDALAPFLADDTAAAIEEGVASAWQASVARALDAEAAPLLAQADLREALRERLLGAPPSFLRLTEDERFRVAVHEVGHALAALAFAGGFRLVTIRPGRTMFGTTLAEPCPAAPTLDVLFGELRIGLGGLAAERVAGIPAGTGCGGDTLRVSELALRAVELFAAGPRSGAFNPDASVRRRGHRDPELSEALLARADLDAQALVDDALTDVTRMLRRAGRRRILALADTLAERETMTGPEFAAHTQTLEGWTAADFPDQDATVTELRFLEQAEIDARYAKPNPRDSIGSDVLFIQRVHAFEGVTDLVALAGALLVRVNKHHPLHDGNKRASITLCDEFLRLNGHHVEGSPDELAAFVWGIAGDLGSNSEESVRERAVERLRDFVHPGSPGEPFGERYPEVIENLAS